MRLLTRKQVAGLLSFPDYVEQVEAAFRLHAEHKSLAPQLMHVDANDGEFHVKGGGLRLDRWYFALKANGSFFQNPSRHGLPAIQGGILLFDAEQGTPLALLDSGEITIQRTGAATAIAVKHLARRDARVATICGCGKQGRVHLTALRHVLRLDRVYAWDVNRAAAERFAHETQAPGGPEILAADDLGPAALASDVIVTCTPSRQPFIKAEWIRPGTFIAAVGADSPGKQELEAAILAPPTALVVDLVNQAAHVGELQHAIAAGLMGQDDVRAELGEIVAGIKAGRRTAEEVTVYDATGTALQDVAAAAVAYRKACDQNVGLEIDLAEA